MQQEPAHHLLMSQETRPSIGFLPPGANIPPHQSASDLSHELRTSLAVIALLSGNLDLLYERLPDEKRRRMIRDIRKHAQRLGERIGDILALCDDPAPTAL